MLHKIVYNGQVINLQQIINTKEITLDVLYELLILLEYQMGEKLYQISSTNSINKSSG